MIAIDPGHLENTPGQQEGKIELNQSKIIQGQPILEEDEQNHRIKEIDDDDGLIEKIDVFDEFEEYKLLA